MGCWVYGGVRLVIILALAGLGESAAILETKESKKKAGKYQHRTHLEAKVPQAGSTTCLTINDAKSNCGSYWSVSVLG